MIGIQGTKYGASSIISLCPHDMLGLPCVGIFSILMRRLIVQVSRCGSLLEGPD